MSRKRKKPNRNKKIKPHSSKPSSHESSLPSPPPPKRGGVRAGAGRPVGEGSTVLRVPNGLVDQVKSLIEAYQTRQKISTIESDLDQLKSKHDGAIRAFASGVKSQNT